MTLTQIPVKTIDGQPTALPEGKALLLVNVASKCGFTKQYAGLEELQQTYGDRGFSVIGIPCNQFGGQEPGTAEEISEFCSTTFGVSFPLLEKVDVNGPDRHPLFEELTAVADEQGHVGDVRWNFEKFLVSPAGEVVARFGTGVEPADLIDAIEAQLPAGHTP